ncbi:MAG: FIST C-terminal domain-containing protein [Bdellovibrionales bacterium]|nr:FIST C-terminal domain-containing protein [Bdellovibrionales bacterium]
MFRVKRSESKSRDPLSAVKEIHSGLGNEKLDSIIAFYSSSYDQDILASALIDTFDCKIIACSSAGEIGSHFLKDGIVAAGLPSSHFKSHGVDIRSVSELKKSVFDDLQGKVAGLSDKSVFALSLIDGLSVQEEKLLAQLNPVLGDIPLIGGSAGDNLEFKETTVFCDGELRSDSATLTLIETDLPFKVFQLQHFLPTEVDLVITAADPSTRTVYEIDGGVAAEEYARVLGMKVEDLSPEVFSKNPVMLQIGDSWYVRSIQKALPDGGLAFYCAIDEGIPLTLARGEDLVMNLERKVKELSSEFSSVAFSLGCDCILRRLEIEAHGLCSDIERLFSELNLIGFHTYGEHFNSIHINQTLTGVVVGNG